MSEFREQVRMELAGMYEAGEYHKRAKSNAEYKTKDIDKATQAIITLLVAKCEKKGRANPSEFKIDSAEKTYAFNAGYNQCLTDLINEMEGEK